MKKILINCNATLVSDALEVNDKVPISLDNFLISPCISLSKTLYASIFLANNESNSLAGVLTPDLLNLTKPQPLPALM